MADQATQPWRVWRRADLCASPWRNGGGITYEIAVGPETGTVQDFDWRVSVAEIDAPGPFSTFAGVDRIIALIDGPAMLLTVDGAPRRLALLDQLAFAGDSDTICDIPHGRTRDLNVMTRRGSVDASLEFVEVRSDRQYRIEAPTVLLGISGRVDVQSPTEVSLAPLDGLEFATAQHVLVAGDGVLAAVRVSPCASR